MNKILIFLGLLSLASMVYYAFTGVTVWAPVQKGDELRYMFLAYIHIACLGAGIWAVMKEFEE